MDYHQTSAYAHTHAHTSFPLITYLHVPTHMDFIVVVFILFLLYLWLPPT